MKNAIMLFSLLSFLFLGQETLAQQTASLNKNEASEIQYMLEEEKLARDVYIALDEKWTAIVFSNISKSEQRHYDKMKALANQYGLKIPPTVQKDEQGKFQNNDLQNAYNEMVETGNTSLVDALRVGAKIEEMDIQDLTEAMANTEHEEILRVYGQLKKASEKHLQSFNRNLAKEGVTYAPVILNQKYFDAIVNAKASCQGDKKEGKACCNGKKGKSANTDKACTGKKGKGKNKKGKACCKSSL